MAHWLDRVIAEQEAACPGIRRAIRSAVRAEEVVGIDELEYSTVRSKRQPLVEKVLDCGSKPG